MKTTVRVCALLLAATACSGNSHKVVQPPCAALVESSALQATALRGAHVTSDEAGGCAIGLPNGAFASLSHIKTPTDRLVEGSMLAPGATLTHVGNVEIVRAPQGFVLVVQPGVVGYSIEAADAFTGKRINLDDQLAFAVAEAVAQILSR